MQALEQYEQELRRRNDELEARAAAALTQALNPQVLRSRTLKPHLRSVPTM